MRNPARQVSISGNSSRVEAASRALVALVFLSALWFDPVQPVRNNGIGETLLAGFLAWSAVLIVIAWRSWWWDHRLARMAHAVDIAVFVAAVYYTEAPSSDFTSPFMAFAVLLLVKARIRWDWRATAGTAVILLALNITVAGTMASNGYAIDLQRVGRRAAYMVLLAVLLVWMGLERRVMLGMPFPMMPAPPDGADASANGTIGSANPLEPLIATALCFACEATGAARAAIAWNAEQEPWIDLGTGGIDPADARFTRLGPEMLAEPSGAAEAGDPAQLHAADGVARGYAVLFSGSLRRALSFDRKGHRIALRPDRPPALAAHLGVDTGISVPITSDAGSGRLLLWDLADPCFDMLTMAQQVAGEVGRAFEHEERARLAQEVAVNGAVSGVREAVARDLHDSAAQFLAGTMFRLEALRRRFAGEPGQGSDADGEIVAIKNAMRLEQVQLRNLIGQLRRGETADRETDLGQELTALLAEVGAHWRLSTALDSGDAPIVVPVMLSHEVRQLVREGVANAARHGGGDAVRIELVNAGAWLWLAISDNGRGFPQNGSGPGGTITIRPRSIAGRVAALGGSLAIEPARPHGARLTIGLPLRPVSTDHRTPPAPSHATQPAEAATAAK